MSAAPTGEQLDGLCMFRPKGRVPEDLCWIGPPKTQRTYNELSKRWFYRDEVRTTFSSTAIGRDVAIAVTVRGRQSG